MAKQTVYEIVTQKILDRLETGTAPWHKPWRGGLQFQPKSFATRKPYNGMNVWLLGWSAQENGYQSPYWITYKKAQSLEGQVRKGQKGTLVVFWKTFETEKTTDSGKKETSTHWMLRYYTVFNIDQIDGLDESKLPADVVPGPEETLDFTPIEHCEKIIADMHNRPTMTHSNQRRAFYRPSDDVVHMPNKETFEAETGYYSTTFHELAHSTGHEKRLARKKFNLASFGSCDYSKEELVAEMTAAMLCGVCNIENDVIDNSASYIDNWRKAIKGNVKLVVQAAGQAQKAANYILNK